jgi:hypothetical protein
MANVHSEEGRFSEAQPLLKESLDIRWSLGDYRSVAQGLLSCARLAYHQGQAERFLRLYIAGINLNAEINLPLPPDLQSDYNTWYDEVRKSLGPQAVLRIYQEVNNTGLSESVEFALKEN